MMAAYSPHREDRDTAHLGSAVHSHLAHLDPHTAIREIRRSLSRSPSKVSEFRQYTFRPLSPLAASIPFHPSPLSPSKRTTADNFLSPLPSPHNRATPSSRFTRPPIRRSGQAHSVVRVRTSPKSPSKRILADSSDSGNSSPMPLRKRTSTEAERESLLVSSSFGDDKENSSQESLSAWKSPQPRQEKRRSGGSFMGFVAPISPMKRTDMPSTSDTGEFQSPSAKRRSLHGPSLDFSIFESDSPLNSWNENRSQDDNDWFRHASSVMSASRFSTIPKRSSSLRKSTLQQRQTDKLSNLKVNQVADSDGTWFDATPGPKKPLRTSLDNHLAPMPRDSPFSSQGSLLNASIHPLSSVNNSQEYSSQPPLPHPLSRALTQSSSLTSSQDNSPTHEPIHRPNRPRSHDFSKSLPVGATRPEPSDFNEYSSQGSFATPANYKSAKPLPAAFMSTGLISKKNRNAEDDNGGLPKAHMPDTPCKKQSVIFAPTDKFVVSKPAIGRQLRQSFGTPATPLEVHNGLGKASVFPYSKNGSIFGTRSNKNTLMRKTSFASIENDEKLCSQSPTGRGDSQSTDADFPPTPTKHTIDERKPSVSPSPHPSRTLPMSRFNFAPSQESRFSISKLPPIIASPGSADEDGDSVMDDSPSAHLKPMSALKDSSVPRPSQTIGRALRNFNSPTPLSRSVQSVLFKPFTVLDRAKMDSLSPVTAQGDQFDRLSPHTPLEGFFPDPSSLTISGRDRAITRPGSQNGAVIPATPTGPREYFPNFSNRPSLSLTAADIIDVDSSLTSRFEKVDLVGTGEFSQVYRVSQPPETSPYHKIYSVSSSRPSSRSSIPERVWAVKKSRYPYAGAKDRLRKIHEVDVLKALGHSDHILTYIDSWEQQGHLYIQTEFCEEGTLDVFLAQAGLKARLDDFRIWKILLELSLGLKHIHDSGFIHLDLKPANVFITFEGVLRIGDFGMAARWPAEAGIEGEGDREYIGPEILMGKFDKPADIFALGLIMLETAGNVELPDNGASWQKLRNGDMSDVPSLTWSSEASNISRDATGQPLPEEEQFDEDVEFSNLDEEEKRKSIQPARSGELIHPPSFMVDASHNQSLEKIVRWMISPNPADRPVAQALLAIEGARWAHDRRRAGATVFEGNWGPADEVLAEDAEMIDV